MGLLPYKRHYPSSGQPGTKKRIQGVFLTVAATSRCRERLVPIRLPKTLQTLPRLLLCRPSRNFAPPPDRRDVLSRFCTRSFVVDFI